MLYNGSMGGGGIGNLNDRMLRRRTNGLQRQTNAPMQTQFGKVEASKGAGGRMPSAQARVQTDNNSDARNMIDGLGLMKRAAGIKEKLGTPLSGSNAADPLKQPLGYSPVANEAGEVTLAAAEKAPELGVTGTAPTANMTGDIALQAVSGETPAWSSFLTEAARKPADLIAMNAGADAAATGALANGAGAVAAPLAGELLPSVTGAAGGAIAGMGAGAGLGAGLEALNAGAAALTAGGLGAGAATLSPEVLALMAAFAPIGL